MRLTRGRIVLLVLLLAVAVLFVWPEAPAGPTGGWIKSAGLAERYETVDGLRVRYLRAGSGPTVVLLHGFASSVVTWREVLPALARDHDVLALDFPGFGWSDQPADLTADALPRVVAGLLDRVGISRASFVGSSLGGAVSLAVASRQPDRVERLVLLDAAGFNLAPADRPWMLRVTASFLGPLLGRLPIRRYLVRRSLRQVFHDDRLVTDERVEEYVAPVLRAGATASMRSVLRSAASGIFADFPRVIAGVRVPTLVVWGRQDAWIPVEHAERFAAAIPGCRVVILEGCGHLPQEERPAETLRLIREFLAGAPPESAQR